MTDFRARVERAIRESGTHLCVGIDPAPDQIPAGLRTDNLISDLNQFVGVLLDAATSRVGAVKFQSAFFEAYGHEGVACLEGAIAESRRRGLTTILDAKRSDIASTMEAYGRSAFDSMNADALTVVPYLGWDTFAALNRWMARGHGVYVVWRTSNPSADTYQSFPSSTGKTHAVMIAKDLLARANHGGCVGAFGFVFGATRLEGQGRDVFELPRTAPLLIPGLGAQGADIKAVQALVKDFPNSLVSVSRALYAAPAASTWHEFRHCVADNVRAYASDRLAAVGERPKGN